jgi:hypothetical protein
MGPSEGRLEYDVNKLEAGEVAFHFVAVNADVLYAFSLS